MDKQYLHEKLSCLRSQYLDLTNGEILAKQVNDAQMSKKCFGLRKN